MRTTAERPALFAVAIPVLAMLFILVMQAPTQIAASEVSSHEASLAIDAPLPQEGRDPESFLPYLFAVFSITWIAFFGYVFLMSRRQREMQREMEALRKDLEEKDKAEREK